MLVTFGCAKANSWFGLGFLKRVDVGDDHDVSVPIQRSCFMLRLFAIPGDLQVNRVGQAFIKSPGTENDLDFTTPYISIHARSAPPLAPHDVPNIFVPLRTEDLFVQVFGIVIVGRITSIHRHIRATLWYKYRVCIAT